VEAAGGWGLFSRELRNSNLSSGRMWLPDAIVVLYLPGMAFFTG